MRMSHKRALKDVRRRLETMQTEINSLKLILQDLAKAMGVTLPETGHIVAEPPRVKERTQEQKAIRL